MKLISLNTWCGHVFDPLIDFVQKNASDTDIFCLQEVTNTQSDEKTYKEIRADLLSQLQNVLPGFAYFYIPLISGYNIFGITPEKIDFNMQLGLVIFLKKGIKIKEKGSRCIYHLNVPNFDFNIADFSLFLQYLTFQHQGKNFTLFNYHGAPYPGSKLDTDFRVKQSNEIRKFIKQFDTNKILVGDFNLMPDTKSIAILEEDMKNLIKEFKVSETRSKLNPFYNTDEYQGFADYTFVDEGVKVHSFEVPKVEASDHLPMVLTFS